MDAFVRVKVSVCKSLYVYKRLCVKVSVCNSGVKAFVCESVCACKKHLREKASVCKSVCGDGIR